MNGLPVEILVDGSIIFRQIRADNCYYMTFDLKRRVCTAWITTSNAGDYLPRNWIAV